MTKKIDSIYSSPQQRIIDFAFDESVAEVFDDMIERSVPGYRTLVSLIGLLAQEYALGGTRAYDLGCSLGAITLSMRRRIASDNFTIVAVDNSEAMLAKCRKRVENEPAGIEVDFLCEDISHSDIFNASVVVLNFTLQFIEPEKRQILIDKIHQGLVPGGALILSEKIVFPSATENTRFTQLHHAFKRANGYSELEISQKRAALEKVLIPDTLEQHRSRLNHSGFTRVDVWFQCLNFASMVAVK